MFGILPRCPPVPSKPGTCAGSTRHLHAETDLSEREILYLSSVVRGPLGATVDCGEVGLSAHHPADGQTIGPVAARREVVPDNPEPSPAPPGRDRVSPYQWIPSRRTPSVLSGRNRLSGFALAPPHRRIHIAVRELVHTQERPKLRAPPPRPHVVDSPATFSNHRPFHRSGWSKLGAGVAASAVSICPNAVYR